MKIDRRLKRKIGQVIKYAVLLLYLIIVMFPFFWMLLTSLKGTQAEIYAFPVQYFPESPSLVHYISMLW